MVLCDASPDFNTFMHDTYSTHNATVVPACESALGSEGAWRCFFANNSYAYSSTHFFPLQSVYDAWQVRG